MDVMLQDLKYALRQLLKSPGFSIIAVVTLALGIGANTAIFSVMNAVLLRPLPYPHSEALVRVQTAGLLGDAIRMPVSYPDYRDLGDLRGTVSGVAITQVAPYNLSGNGDPRELTVGLASPSLFSVLGIPPLLGRTFATNEEQEPVAVLSQQFWKTNFGGDPNALGKMVTLDGRGYQVIGVMPSSMRYPRADVALWIPVGWSWTVPSQFRMIRTFRGYDAIVRLAPGVSLDGLRSHLAVLARNIESELQASMPGPPAPVEPQTKGDTNFFVGRAVPGPGQVNPIGDAHGSRKGSQRPGKGVTSQNDAPFFQQPAEDRSHQQADGRGAGAKPQVMAFPKLTVAFWATRLRDDVVGDRDQAIALLAGAVALVLLIACTNTASLLIARGTTRQKEMAVRSMLGARRTRLVRQLLTESLVLAVGGAAIGIGVAYLTLRGILVAWPDALPQQNDIAIDAPVLAFTLTLAVLTGLAFGLLPAFKASSTAFEEALRLSGRVAVRTTRRTLAALIVGEIALALVLLVTAGLLTRSLTSLNEVEPGFDTHNLLAARIRLTPARYASPQAQQQFFDNLVATLRHRPQISDVALAGFSFPLSGGPRIVVGIRPQLIDPSDPEQSLTIVMTIVSPDFFSALRIPILQGRSFQAQDRAGLPRVIVVNTRLARRLWPGQDPLGKIIPMLTVPGMPAGPATVVGVVGDMHGESLSASVGPEVFFPLAQAGPIPIIWVGVRGPELPSLAPAVVEAVRTIDAQQPVALITSVSELIDHDQSSRRLNTKLITIFAVTATLLAIIGTYGVTAYAVSQRSREFGVRLALGAHPFDLLRLVMGEGLALVLTGIIVGLLIAAAMTRALTSFLFGVQALDLVTFVGAALLLAGAALTAALLPAQRAGRVDPITSLRSE